MAEPIERMVLKYRAVLEHTERLPPDELRQYQANLLTSLVQHASSNVPYYRVRLAPLARGEDVDLARWADVPVLTRPEAQLNASAMTARTLPPHSGPVESGETSGSTGRPTGEPPQAALVKIANAVKEWADQGRLRHGVDDPHRDSGGACVHRDALATDQPGHDARPHDTLEQRRKTALLRKRSLRARENAE
jgi:hypothetical protein